MRTGSLYVTCGYLSSSHDYVLNYFCFLLCRFDGPNSNELKLLIETFWAGGKVVSAVCHGPAGLVSACRPDGKPIVDGKRVGWAGEGRHYVCINVRNAIAGCRNDTARGHGWCQKAGL